MNRYKNYTHDVKIGNKAKNRNYSKGYERHPVGVQELNAGNDLPHIKWFNNRTNGHIYYEY